MLDLTKHSPLRSEGVFCLESRQYVVGCGLCLKHAKFFPVLRKKALLRVNDRGGGRRMCILALCRACVSVRLCVRVFCTCVLLYQINHARAIACTHNFVQCVYSVHRVLRRRTMHISN